MIRLFILLQAVDDLFSKSFQDYGIFAVLKKTDRNKFRMLIASNPNCTIIFKLFSDCSYELVSLS